VSDYLTETRLWSLSPDQKALADGERFCTSLRRGASVADGVKQMQAGLGEAHTSQFVAHIAAGAEQHLCPDQHDKFDAWYSAFLKAPSTSSSASATAISTYLSMFRGMSLPQFSPQQTSDAKLIAAGREACSDLTTHKPAEVLTILEHEGWSRGDGSDIIAYATELCPGSSKAVEAWEMDVLDAGSNGTG
jgi:hypothetical protein